MSISWGVAETCACKHSTIEAAANSRLVRCRLQRPAFGNEDRPHIVGSVHVRSKHTGDSLGAFGQFNNQFTDGFDPVGTDDNFFENLLIVGVVALTIVGKLVEQKVVSRFPELSFRA